jgi:hypothetical protein
MRAGVYARRKEVNFMKIADIRTYVVENPTLDFGGLYRVFLKLTTDNGVAV